MEGLEFFILGLSGFLFVVSVITSSISKKNLREARDKLDTEMTDYFNFTNNILNQMEGHAKENRTRNLREQKKFAKVDSD